VIDYDYLMKYRIPEVRQRITPRDAALYALSVGFGQTPTDTHELEFVDFSRALKVVPSIPVVLGHPGFWLASPDTGVDATRLVHGEQSIEIHAPLRATAQIVGRTRVVGLADKGIGKGALLYSQKEVIDVESDTLLATTGATIFLRGDGGFGGPATVSSAGKKMSVPQGDPDFTVDLPTRPEQALYYRLNGDENPLHSDPEAAVAAGFPSPILHGLCTLGIVCRAVLRVLAGYTIERFTGLSLRFSAPVFPGETVRTELWKDGNFQARVVERNVLVITNGFANVVR
jgi:acyl dehydratase